MLMRASNGGENHSLGSTTLRPLGAQTAQTHGALSPDRHRRHVQPAAEDRAASPLI